MFHNVEFEINMDQINERRQLRVDKDAIRANAKRYYQEHDRRQGRYYPLRDFDQWRNALRPKEKGETDV